MAGPGWTLTDASGNTWSVLDGHVEWNGLSDTTTANVVAVAYVNGAVWQENGSGMWFKHAAPTAAYPWLTGTATAPVASDSAYTATITGTGKLAYDDTIVNLSTNRAAYLATNSVMSFGSLTATGTTTMNGWIGLTNFNVSLNNVAGSSLVALSASQETIQGSTSNQTCINLASGSSLILDKPTQFAGMVEYSGQEYIELAGLNATSYTDTNNVYQFFLGGKLVDTLRFLNENGSGQHYDMSGQPVPNVTVEHNALGVMLSSTIGNEHLNQPGGVGVALTHTT
jgi:hypothetical protein